MLNLRPIVLILIIYRDSHDEYHKLNEAAARQNVECSSVVEMKP